MHYLGIAAAVFLGLVMWSRWEEWRIRLHERREMKRIRAMVQPEPKPGGPSKRFSFWAANVSLAVIALGMLLMAAATHG
jgi:hypothetical protein